MGNDGHLSDPASSQFRSRSQDQSAAHSLLLHWDTDIRRAAFAVAHQRALGRDRADDLAQEARFRILQLARSMGPCEEPYVRTVIANAVRRTARREARHLDRMLLVGDLPLPEHPDTTLEPPSDVLSLATDAIRRWIRSLSARLQAVYHLLYVRGCTQREAATVIGVTQPSVAQLHRQLLQRGRRELLHLWA